VLERRRHRPVTDRIELAAGRIELASERIELAGESPGA
jgi:hypothetical protein